jgi:hypothetical protein
MKFILFSGFVAIGLVFGTNLGMANTITLSGTNNTTAETVTGSTGSFDLTSGGTLTVSGSSADVTLNGSNPSTISVTNDGTIDQTGTAQAVVDAGGHMTVTINNGSSTDSAAEMETSNGDVIHFDHATNNVTLNNYGTLDSQNSSAGGNQAVDFNGITDGATAGEGANTLNNYSTGLIEATEADAVRPGIDGFVNNSGTILSTSTTDSSSDGIDAQTNSGITIVNAAGLGTGGANLIEGARHGITGGAEVNTSDSDFDQPFTMTITNNVGGTIQGDNGSGINLDGVDATEVVTVTNNGTITGDGITRDGDGIDVDGLVHIINSGTILSKNAFEDASEGVTVGGGTIVNSGTIEGSNQGGTSAYGRGITLAGIDHTTSNNAQGVETDFDIPIQSIYGTTTVTNNLGGLIKGDSESGIAVLGTTGGGFTVTINNNAGATIEGSNTGVSEDVPLTTGNEIGALSGGSLNQAAIELDDTSNTYVINESGTIQQDTTSTGTAIAMHGVSNTLNITGGTASIIGAISGDTAADSTLTINPGAGNSFSYGYGISNFTVKINSDGTNGTVTLSGNSNNTGTTTISGGTLLVTGTTTGGGAYTVASGAALGGAGGTIGTASANVTLNSGASLNVSDHGTANALTPGELTFNLGSGALDVSAVAGSAAGELKFALDTTTTSDEVAMGSGSTLNIGVLKLALSDFSFSTANNFGVGNYILFDSSSPTGITGLLSLTGESGTVDGFAATLVEGVDGMGNEDLVLDVQPPAVPEPPRWMLLLGGLLFLMIVGRFRQARSWMALSGSVR